jgi:hypothetical protein
LDRTFYVRHLGRDERNPGGFMPAEGTNKIDHRIVSEISRLALIDPTATAPEVHAIVKPFAAERDLYLGKVDTTRRTMQKARAAKGPEDKPWSLAAPYELTGSLIPADALPTVLSVWRWHLIGGTTFTIRQAKWAARLREVVASVELDYKDLQLAKLALEYASEELGAAVTRRPFTTGRLDVDLAYRQVGLTGNNLNVSITRSAATQAEQLVKRDSGYELPASYMARIKWDGTNTKIEDPSHILDEIAHGILTVVQLVTTQDEPFNRAAYDLVVLAARRDEEKPESWGDRPEKSRREWARTMYAKAKAGNVTDWPHMWGLKSGALTDWNEDA